MAGPSEALETVLEIHDIQNSKAAAGTVRPLLLAFPVVLDVAGRSPHIANVFRPEPGFARAPFTDAEQNRSTGSLQGVTHQRVRSLRVLRAGAAPIVL